MLQKVVIYNQERFDKPDFDNVQTFTKDEFRAMVQNVFAGCDRSYVLNGFVTSDAGGLDISVGVSDSALFDSKNDGQFYAGGPVHTPLTATMTDNTTNYVHLVLSTVAAGSTTRAFWDTVADQEFNQVVDTAEALEVTLLITTSGFSTDIDKIPIAEVVTSGGDIVNLYDRRNDFWRLAEGYPEDTAHEYPWADRTEPDPDVLVDPAAFTGGDKQIKTLKEWIDAVMTEIKEIKFGTASTRKWFEETPIGLSEVLRENEFVLSNGGLWKWLVSGSSNFFNQTSEQTTWTATHNVGTQYTHVSIFDENDEKIYSDTTFANSASVATLTFTTARLGRASFSAGTNSYLHTQGAPSLTWTITHGLAAQYVCFTLYDGSGNVIQPDTVTAIAPGTLTVTFLTVQSGFARIQLGSDENYLYTQAVADKFWEIPHTLGAKFVDVELYDDITDEVVRPERVKFFFNKIIVEWAAARTGYAILSSEKNSYLTFSEVATIQIPETPYTNTIQLAQSPIILDTDGDVAYVDINPASNAALTVTVVSAAAFADQTLRAIIARRIGNSVYVGIGSTAIRLDDGESSQLAGSPVDAMLQPSAQTTPDMTVYVEAGWFNNGNVNVRWAGGSSPVITAPAAYPRIDLLFLNLSGELEFTSGAEAAVPEAPSHAGLMVIAELYLVPGMTAISNADVEDVRGFLNLGVQHRVRDLFVATPGQTLFNLINVEYAPGSETLDVYKDGAHQDLFLDYDEASATSVMFLTPLVGGETIVFKSTRPVGTLKTLPHGETHRAGNSDPVQLLSEQIDFWNSEDVVLYSDIGVTEVARWDGASGNIGIGTAPPLAATYRGISFKHPSHADIFDIVADSTGKLIFHENGVNIFQFGSDVIFNNDSTTNNFRIKSSTLANAFYLDGTTGLVTLGGAASIGGSLSVGGNIGVAGTVDGVDVSVLYTDFTNHAAATTAHGSVGAIVGTTTMNLAISAAITAHEGATNPHSQYARIAISESITGVYRFTNGLSVNAGQTFVYDANAGANTYSYFDTTSSEIRFNIEASTADMFILDRDVSDAYLRIVSANGTVETVVGAVEAGTDRGSIGTTTAHDFNIYANGSTKAIARSGGNFEIQSSTNLEIVSINTGAVTDDRMVITGGGIVSKYSGAFPGEAVAFGRITSAGGFVGSGATVSGPSGTPDYTVTFSTSLGTTNYTVVTGLYNTNTTTQDARTVNITQKNAGSFVIEAWAISVGSLTEGPTTQFDSIDFTVFKA